jgi:hypothetical protein
VRVSARCRTPGDEYLLTCGVIQISAGVTEHRSSTAEKEFAMFDDSNRVRREYERDLDAWTCAWYDAAVARDFIRSPYHLDVVTVKQIRGYFHLNLTPAEALKPASRESTERGYLIVASSERSTVRKGAS